MKPWLLSLLFLMLTGCARLSPDVQGKWLGTGRGGPLEITLASDHTVRFVAGTNLVFDESMQKIEMRWSKDDTHEPKRISITIKDEDGTQELPIIYNLLDTDTMVIKMGVDAHKQQLLPWSALTWEDMSDAIVMKRVP